MRPATSSASVSTTERALFAASRAFSPISVMFSFVLSQSDLAHSWFRWRTHMGLSGRGMFAASIKSATALLTDLRGRRGVLTSG